MNILRFLRTTPGGMHGWFEAEHGGRIFEIRKPLNNVKFWTPAEKNPESGIAQEPKAPRLSWWLRIKIWFINLWK